MDPSLPGRGATGARVLALTTLAMVAFASNSLLCRGALRDGAIDAASFTALRLVSGALVLVFLVLPRSKRLGAGSWGSALALFAYAAGFSLAYRRLDAGTGALVLFGAVQLTMVLAGRLAGQRLARRQWQGYGLSLLGLVVLTLPGAGPAEPVGALLMAGAGAAWDVYSIRGRGAGDAAGATAGNFVRAVPLAALLAWLSGGAHHVSAQGLSLAVASGVASALGYVIWYAALRHLLAVEAALVQLSVPVLTAAGSVALLGEPVTLRALLAGGTILAGIALAVTRPAAARASTRA